MVRIAIDRVQLAIDAEIVCRDKAALSDKTADFCRFRGGLATLEGGAGRRRSPGAGRGSRSRWVPVIRSRAPPFAFATVFFWVGRLFQSCAGQDRARVFFLRTAHLQIRRAISFFFFAKLIARWKIWCFRMGLDRPVLVILFFGRTVRARTHATRARGSVFEVVLVLCSRLKVARLSSFCGCWTSN